MLVVLLLIPLGMFLYGVVLSVLWNWFMVSTLHLPALNVAQALGIILVLGVFTSQSTLTSTWLRYKLGKLSEKEEKAAMRETAFVDFVVAPLLMLAMGCIVHLFV